MTKPIRVVYIISDLRVGGAETMLYKLLAETDRTRFDPIVISMVHGGAMRKRIEDKGVAVHSLGMKRGWPTAVDFWRLVRLVRSLRPRIIVGWMYHGCLAAQLAKQFSLLPASVLWSIHYSPSCLETEKKLTASVIRACRFLSGRPAKIIFVSHDGQSKHKLLGFEIKESCVIPNGIDGDEFAPSAEARASFRAELGLPSNALLIGMIARSHPVKDQPNFLRAAAIAALRHPDTHFLLAGRGVKGNRDLYRLVESLGLQQRTHLLDERPDVPRIMAGVDIFSLSSYCESFPSVIGEAMACNLPCVVTDVGDASLIVGDTGRVVPARDAEALAEGWSKLIADGREQRAAMGCAARSRIRKLFPARAIAAAYEAQFQQALAAEPVGRYWADKRSRGLEYQINDAPQPDYQE